MDIDYLKKHLKQEYSYQDAPKDIFLVEVASIFEAHHNSGDTELLIYKGSCASEFCGNCSKKGYRLIGNVSRNYFDLIFQIEEDDIKDIFSCSEFKTDDDSGELATYAGVDIDEDDRIHFNKTPEYWNKLNRAIEAYDELICEPPRIVTLEDCNYWINKYSFLNESIGGQNMFSPQMKWTKFSNLYAEIKEWCDFMNVDLDLMREAIEKFRIDFTESDLIAWVIEYEELFERVPGRLKYYLKKYDGYYETDLITPLFVKGKEFSSLADFSPKFFEHHSNLMEKYRAFTHIEETDIHRKFGFHNDVENLSTLEYHLKTREILKTLGIELPLFLNRSKDD